MGMVQSLGGGASCSYTVSGINNTRSRGIIPPYLNLHNLDSSLVTLNTGFPGGSVAKDPPAGDVGSIPGSGRFPCRREWQPTPVFLPGESHK